MAKTFSNVKGVFGLYSSATPARANSSGTALLGQNNGSLAWPDADYVYSFKTTCTTTADVTALTVDTGDVTNSAGSPTIEFNNADFEGDALDSISTLYAVLIECTTGGTMDVGGSFITTTNGFKHTGDILQWVWKDGFSLTTETITLDQNEVGGVYEVTVIGRTT